MLVLPFPSYSFYYFILYCTAGIPPFYSLFCFSITYRALVYYSNTPLLTVYKTTKVCYVGRTTLTEVLSSGLSSSDFIYASSTPLCAVTADLPSPYHHTFSPLRTCCFPHLYAGQLALPSTLTAINLLSLTEEPCMHISQVAT